MRETIKRHKIYSIIALSIVIIFVLGIILFIIYRSASSAASSTAFIGALISALIGAAAALAGAIITAFFANRQEKRASEQLKLSQRQSQQVEAMARLTQQKIELQKQQLELEKQQQMFNRQSEAIILLEKDPRLAIVIAFQGLETEIDRAINQLVPPDTKSDETPMEEPSDTFSNKAALLSKYLDPLQMMALINMRDLRNRIVHGEVKPQEVSQDKAKDYVQQAFELAKRISSIEA